MTGHRAKPTWEYLVEQMGFLKIPAVAALQVLEDRIVNWKQHALRGQPTILPTLLRRPQPGRCASVGYVLCVCVCVWHFERFGRPCQFTELLVTKRDDYQACAEHFSLPVFAPALNVYVRPTIQQRALSVKPSPLATKRVGRGCLLCVFLTFLFARMLSLYMRQHISRIPTYLATRHPKQSWCSDIRFLFAGPFRVRLERGTGRSNKVLIGYVFSEPLRTTHHRK